MPRYIDAHRPEALLRALPTYHGVISIDTVMDYHRTAPTAERI